MTQNSDSTDATATTEPEEESGVQNEHERPTVAFDAATLATVDDTTDNELQTVSCDPATADDATVPVGSAGDPEPNAADITALRGGIEKADRLIAHYHQGARLAQDLKRTLVLRLLHTQYPRLSIDEEAKLLKSYGVATEPPKT